jgi:hypothetical protein
MSLFLAELAVGLSGSGLMAARLVLIDKPLARAEQTGARWELLLLGRVPTAIGSAEACFQQAVDVGAKSGRALLGLAGCDEPGETLAWTAASDTGTQTAGGGLPPLHRGIRNCRSQGRQSAHRVASLNHSSAQAFGERHEKF